MNPRPPGAGAFAASDEPRDALDLLIAPPLAGQRLDVVLTSLLPGVSRTHAHAAIQRGEVSVDGRPAKPGQRLEVDQRLRYAPRDQACDAATSAPRAEPLPLRVIYEDAHLLVIDKPAGLVVHPAPGHPHGTLVNALLAHAPAIGSTGEAVRPGIVHRLDKDTSGLLVVAKDDAALAGLAAQLRGRTMEKRYLALIEGRMPVPEGSIEAPIGRDPRQRQRMAVVREASGGREARTRFRELRAARGRSLLELRLESGRTHQVRVHLAAVGHPVVGDPLYGRPQPPQPPRQFLHAAHLGFTHPISGAPMAFDAPLPDDLARFLAAWQA